MELNSTDRGIIEQLRANSRQSNRATGLALNVSEETVRRRTAAMVEAGVIHFGITIAAAELGYTVLAMLTVKVITGASIADVVDAIIDPCGGIDIVSVNVTLAKRLIVRIAARDLETLQDEIEHIRLGAYVEDISAQIFQTNSAWRL